MLKEKLEIAKKLRNSSKSFSKHIEHQMLFRKCYRSYVLDCIFKGKDCFQLKFKGKYIRGFTERVQDWYDYVLDNISKFCCLVFVPKKYRPKRKYPFLYHKIYLPTHVKVTDAPNEFILKSFLESNGLKVVEEHLYSLDTVYDIAKI